MKKPKLFSRIDSWFFAPVPPHSIALFRLLFGLLVTVYAFYLAPGLETWFGPRGPVSFETAQKLSLMAFDAPETGPQLSLLALAPTSTPWLRVVHGALIVAAISLAAGFRSRLSAAVVFLCLVSFHQRNPIVLNGGEILMRIAALMLVFSPGTRTRESPPWAQRLFQIQVVGLYFSSFAWKLKGSTWYDGSAVAWVLRIPDFRHFPLPTFLDHGWGAAALTWLTMAIEAGLACVIFIPQRRVRYAILSLGALFHLGLEYSMNIPFFSVMMIVSFVVFIDPKDVQSWLSKRPRLLKLL